MTDIELPSIDNPLLRFLLQAEPALSSLEKVTLELGQELETPDRAIEHVYFLESGLLSMLATAEGRKIEAAMIGFEGMTGTAVVLASPHASHSVLVQSPGTAHRLPVAAFEATFANPALRRLWLRYAHVLMVQVTQTALANGQASLLERLARWILMWHDRVREPEFKVTHAYIAVLLGVRRAGVTVALHRLEGDRLIRSDRNRITVLDRDGLASLANGYYGKPEAEYAQLIKQS